MIINSVILIPSVSGKCDHQQIQNMVGSSPHMVTPVGVNAEIIAHGLNWFLASTEAELTEALRSPLRDLHLRARVADDGRRRFEAHYELQARGSRVAHILRDVASQDRRSRCCISA